MSTAGPYDPALVREFTEAGWWGTDPLAVTLDRHAGERGGATAFASPDRRLTWHGYREAARDLAAVLAGAGARLGDRVAVLLPDAVAVHVAYAATELAGVCAVGVAHRADPADVAHLLARTGAVLVVTDRPGDARYGVPLVLVDDLGRPGPAAPRRAPERALGPDELYLVNSTSGTTGRPKIVMHTQNRWLYFARLAVDAGGLTPDDVVASLVPAPYGFGLWSGHVAPALLGAPCVVTERFDAAAALDLLARERVTVLAAVTTQLIMLLDAWDARVAAGGPVPDLSALRVVFTGGERVPYERAAEFEDRTGAVVLQFYGANETGAISRTTVRDPREARLRTAGRPVPEMAVRLFDDEGRDVTAAGGPGVPGCRGPAMGPGYWDDPAANAALTRPDGWMLMGDIASIGPDGYLTVVGRTADFVVRGGRNISAPRVEEYVATHPAVAGVAAVAAPDPVFGERVCAYVVPRAGQRAPDLAALREHLAARQVPRECWPEYVVALPELPCSPGGKADKRALREDAARRFGAAGPAPGAAAAG